MKGMTENEKDILRLQSTLEDHFFVRCDESCKEKKDEFRPRVDDVARALTAFYDLDGRRHVHPDKVISWYECGDCEALTGVDGKGAITVPCFVCGRHSSSWTRVTQ